MYSEGLVRTYGKGAFFNSAARLTRDIGTAIASGSLGKGYSVLDATAATGLRGMRYLLEGKAGSCTFLEINRTAYAALRRNLSMNKVEGRALNTSIQEFANSARERFDLIDLDPFGGVQPYVYDLMKLVRSGSLFFATATDTAVLCGAHHSACVRLYSSVPMHNELCKEAGIRILLGYIARVAASFDFGMEPLLSINYLHYMRVHTRLSHGSRSAAVTMKGIGYMHYCNSCGRRGVQQGLIPKRLECSCGARLQLSGPLWTGRLHDQESVRRACASAGEGLAAGSRGFLERLAMELDTPVLYDIPRMTRRLGMASVSPYKVMEELKTKGHAASQTHFSAACIRTEAPFEDVEDAIRGLCKRRNGKT